MILEPFGTSESLGLRTDFALTNTKDEGDYFIQAYDIQAPESYPDLFYLPNPLPDVQMKKQIQNSERDITMRIWVGGLTFFGLFILYRCLIKD
jgi:hypothetical protein